MARVSQGPIRSANVRAPTLGQRVSDGPICSNKCSCSHARKKSIPGTYLLGQIYVLPRSDKKYPRDRSAQTNVRAYHVRTKSITGTDRDQVPRVRAATLKQESQIKLSVSPTCTLLTQGQPVLALMLCSFAPGRVATRVPVPSHWDDPLGESEDQSPCLPLSVRTSHHLVSKAVWQKE